MLIFRRITKGIAAAIAGGAFLLNSCSYGAKEMVEPDDVVASYKNEYLTMGDIRDALPGGLSPDDSVRFVKAYITSWVEEKLVTGEAADAIDMTEINRLVEDYRRNLIVTAYRRSMFERYAQSVEDDSIRAYYETHKNDFILERPMIKGTYLKVPDDAHNLRLLKRLYKSDRPADADRLEKEVLSSAIHYDYFRDKWVDWEQVETKIPEDFGTSPSAWLAKNKTLEKSNGGFTYLLYVTDILPAGSPMPFENARSQIVNRLLNINRSTYDAALFNELYQRAVEDGALVIKTSN